MRYRIVFTEIELVAGAMRDVEHSSKWMSESEIASSKLILKPGARVVAMPDREPFEEYCYDCHNVAEACTCP